MRESFRFLTAGLSLLIVVGCSESPSAPTATPARSLSASSPSFNYDSYRSSYGDSFASFIVTPAGGSYSVNGLFDVNFPANSVCDPDLSSYGEGTWNSSCVPLNRALRITAQVRLSSGGISVDFQPALRFVPTTRVTVSTDLFASFIKANRGYFNANPAALRPFAMYYSPFIGGSRVADYLSDRSLVTHIDLNTGRVWRRVKHFSGYNVTSGESCDPADGDPDCIEVDGRF